MSERLNALPRISVPLPKGRKEAECGDDRSSAAEANQKLRGVLHEVLQLDTDGVLDSVNFKDVASLPSLEECASDFRRVVCAEIAKHWPRNKPKAQAASDLLDRGNALLIAFERSGGSATTSAAAHEPADDSFWELPAEHWRKLLVLEAVRGPGPVTLHEEPAGGLRKRRQDGRGRKQEHEWTGLARVKIKASQLPQNVQHQLALLLERVLGFSKSRHQVDSEAEAGEGTSAMVIIQRCVEKLHSGADGEALLTLPLDFSDICQRLRKGALPSLAEVTQLVAEACQEAGVEAGFAAAESKALFLQQADALSAELAIALRDIVATFKKEGVVLTKAYYMPSVDLPESIRANSEAYFQGEWRKAPYAPRPYQRLEAYHIEEDRKILSWKMSTTKLTKCSGEHCVTPGQLGTFSLEKESFRTECGCLARNSECGPACGCRGQQCLNSAIQRRAALRLGRDVAERDTWGMDCYTRRNIQDAVLEAEAFGPYKRPDYKALLRKKNAAVMSQGETLQHSLKGSEAGIEQPQQGEVEAEPTEAEAQAEESQAAVICATAKWHEAVLMPAINQQVHRAWDLSGALDSIQRRDAGTASAKAAAAVAARLKKVGENYFRVHPKGVGIICQRPDGLPPLTFVEEYFGEVHMPSRWFEVQDALKKSSKDELPDFYNIQLERPKDDPGGYDCLFIDAASKGAFASRMSHSCTPNCQAVVMTSRGRLTIAVYTLRHIQSGEELTFDYSSVTESEKEFRAAVCLCGTTACRGSFLYFAGSKAFMQVLSTLHGMFARQVMLLRAGAETVTEEDRARLERFGVRSCALGWGPGKERVPEWLRKWVCLVLEYVETEQKLLPPQLLAIPPPLGNFTPETAASQAKGVSDNRLQNVVITLDKIKLCLTKPGQPQGPPLLLLTDKETAEYLWTGERSIAKRVLRAAAPGLSNAAVGKSFVNAGSLEELQQAVDGCQYLELQQLGNLVMRPVSNAKAAREALLGLAEHMRALDRESNLAQSAIGDLLFLFASTRNWFRARRDYKGFVSPPVRLNMKDLALDRGGEGLPTAGSSGSEQNGSAGEASGGGAELANGFPAEIGKRPRSGSGVAEASSRLGRPEKKLKVYEASEPSEIAVLNDEEAEEIEEMVEEDDGSTATEAKSKPQRGGLCKKYGPWFVWGQLNGWYKQTVYDPTASLSAERRGTITLPDVECIYSGPRMRYTSKERDALIDQIEKRPDAPWRSNSMWTFRNDAKVFGSPMFDAAWSRAKGSHDPMPAVLAYLKADRPQQ